MQLAKNQIDVGLFTDNVAAMLAFWQGDVGLPFEELLPLGGGARQYRHALNGSVFKLNATRDPLPANNVPSGYRELLIARPGLTAALQLTDPDGNRVALVPPGTDGITGIGVRLAVRDARAFHDFYTRGLGFEAVAPERYRGGDSLLIVDEAPGVPRAGAMRGPGYRYLTVQVFDVDTEHKDLIARGVEAGRPPVTLGAVARISFIRDPDGNWIEVSQRAALTGPLPPGA